MAASPSGAVPDFEEKLRERGITLWLAGLNPEALRVIRRSPLGATLGEKRIFHHLQMAVDAYEAMDLWKGEAKVTDKLGSWNNTPTKTAILDFVAAVSDDSSANHVPPAERVATFDNDGTLWCEKPAYTQLFFAIERLKQMAEADPGLLEKPAFKAAAAGDMGYFAGLSSDIPALLEIVYDTHAGMPQRDFEQLASDFLAQARHPRYDVPFKECVYQPMVELIGHLRDHGFKVFIASAGGMSFMRTLSEEVYGVPRENVIGSNITFEVGRQDGSLVLLRKPGLVEPIDDGPGKPVNIELHIGRPPILAAGNSNGDIEMLEFAEASDKPFVNLLLHHDDAEREYEYDTGAEKALQLASQRGWTVISLKNDFRSVFPFEDS